MPAIVTEATSLVGFPIVDELTNGKMGIRDYFRPRPPDCLRELEKRSMGRVPA